MITICCRWPRNCGPAATTTPIGFFLHIPCPPPDILLALPQHAETLGALGHYDLVGTQTEHDADNLAPLFRAARAASPRAADRSFE